MFFSAAGEGGPAPCLLAKSKEANCHTSRQAAEGRRSLPALIRVAGGRNPSRQITLVSVIVLPYGDVASAICLSNRQPLCGHALPTLLSWSAVAAAVAASSRGSPTRNTAHRVGVILAWISSTRIRRTCSPAVVEFPRKQGSTEHMNYPSGPRGESCRPENKVGKRLEVADISCRARTLKGPNLSASQPARHSRCTLRSPARLPPARSFTPSSSDTPPSPVNHRSL